MNMTKCKINSAMTQIISIALLSVLHICDAREKLQPALTGPVYSIFAFSNHRAGFNDAVRLCSLDGGFPVDMNNIVFLDAIKEFAKSRGGNKEWIVADTSNTMVFPNGTGLAFETDKHNCSTRVTNLNAKKKLYFLCQFKSSESCEAVSVDNNLSRYQGQRLCLSNLQFCASNDFWNATKSSEKLSTGLTRINQKHDVLTTFSEKSCDLPSAAFKIINTSHICHDSFCGGPNNESACYKCGNHECNRRSPIRKLWVSTSKSCKLYKTPRTKNEDKELKAAVKCLQRKGLIKHCVRTSTKKYPKNCVDEAGNSTEELYLCSEKVTYSDVNMTCLDDNQKVLPARITPPPRDSASPRSGFFSLETATAQFAITSGGAMKISAMKTEAILLECIESLKPFCNTGNFNMIQGSADEFKNLSQKNKSLAVFSSSEVLGLSTSEHGSVRVAMAQSKPSQKYLNSLIPSGSRFTSDNFRNHYQVPGSALLHIHAVRKRKYIEAGIRYTMTVDTTAVIKKTLEFNPGYEKVNEIEVRCVFVDKKKNEFSSRGMSVENVNMPNATCTSNHSSMFSVLLVMHSVTVPHGVKVLSYVTEVLSVICLTATCAILMRVRKTVRNERIYVQTNLTVALALFHTFTLLQEIALRNKLLCEMDTVLVHVFLLASAAWMLLEGTTLFVKTLDSTISYRSSRKSKIARLCVGWGLPTVIVMTSSAIGFSTETYMSANPAMLHSALSGNKKYRDCWLNRSSNIFLLTVITPVSIAVLVNFLILVRVGALVFKMSKDADNFRPTSDLHRENGEKQHNNITHVKAAFKALVVLTPALGVPWLLSFAAGTSLVVMYMTTALNGLQGFFLFLVYVVFGKEVRTALVIKLRRGKLDFLLGSTDTSQRTTTFSK